MSNNETPENQKHLHREADGLFHRSYQNYEEYTAHQARKLEGLMEERRELMEHYDEAMMLELYIRLEQTKLLAKGSNVLCLGARLGSECKAFHKYSCFAVGIDLNPGENNRYVLPGDFHNLQFPDSCVDATYSNCVDHVFDLPKFCGEARRVLKPGGLFMVDVMNGVRDEQPWQPDRYDCLFWEKTDDLIAKLKEHLGGDLVLKHPIQNPFGWHGQYVVIKKV